MLAPVITESQTSLDALTGTGECGSMLSQVPVNSAGKPEQGSRLTGKQDMTATAGRMHAPRRRRHAGPDPRFSYHPGNAPE